MRANGIIFLLWVLISVGCSSKPEQAIEHAATLAASSPLLAREILDSIDPGTLNNSDRQLYNLLDIKTRDKLYVKHTSDSLILKVIDYYSRHQNTGLYPEALYYGGRVYADKGDYPTALRYFQESLDLMPSDNSSLYLKGAVLSQTARLLNTLRLYDESVSILKEVIKVDSISRDSLNLIHDRQLLGAVYLHKKELDSAETCFRDARELAMLIAHDLVPNQDIYIAAVEYEQGKIDSAVVRISGLKDIVIPYFHNFALAYGAKIYLGAGMTDSAYVAARELIHSHTSDNRETGYQILLSPLLADKINADSLRVYINAYRDQLEEYWNKTNVDLALLQQSYYNYSLHEKARNRAEHSKIMAQKWIICILSLMLVIMTVCLYLIFKNKQNKLKLRMALEKLDWISQNMGNHTNGQNEKLSANSSDSDFLNGVATSYDLPPSDFSSTDKIHLRDSLLGKYEEGTLKSEVSPALMGVPEYLKLRKYVEEGNSIKENDKFWYELQCAVDVTSGSFRKRLEILTSGTMTHTDRQTALLIKCGLKPNEIATVTGRSQGAVSSRRRALCKKIYGDNVNPRMLDILLLLL